jgi:APA family basic amino acid/polyamine antiporter
LLAFGIGGTVGTGIFALCGLIAADYGGPAVVLCWLIAGIGCIVNGFAYMELSTRIPCAGSTYAYSYVALGELPAVIAGWCLTLEYGVSGAAVARSWSDKVFKWILSLNQNLGYLEAYLSNENADLLGGFIQIASVATLLAGVSLGKRSVNFITAVKVLLVFFMVIVGFYLFDRSNFSTFIPPKTADGKYGWDGILLGGTVAFFGFIGFDEVSCMAAEAKNPGKVMHKAVLGTIIGTTVLSVLAALALIGMQPYQQIDEDSAFGYAFSYNNLQWAAQIAEIGEILTLPVVVLIAFLAQPRLQYAMAQDGLLPKIFGQLDEHGNLRAGILIGGLFCTLLAIFVPFKNLNDLCSAGVLLSFSLSNSSLIMLRTKDGELPNQGEDQDAIKVSPASLLGVYFVFSGMTAMFIVKAPFGTEMWAQIGLSVSLFVGGAAAICLWRIMPIAPLPKLENDASIQTYRAPLVPFIPLTAIFINWLLIAQLSWMGIYLTVGYVALACISYLCYGMHFSVGRTNVWHKILVRNGAECRCDLCKELARSRMFNDQWGVEPSQVPFRKYKKVVPYIHDAQSPYIPHRRHEIHEYDDEAVIPHSFPPRPRLASSPTQTSPLLAQMESRQQASYGSYSHSQHKARESF